MRVYRGQFSTIRPVGHQILSSYLLQFEPTSGQHRMIHCHSVNCSPHFPQSAITCRSFFPTTTPPQFRRQGPRSIVSGAAYQTGPPPTTTRISPLFGLPHALPMLLTR